MFERIKTFLMKLFPSIGRLLLLRRIEQSRKEIKEGKGRPLSSLKDLR